MKIATFGEIMMRLSTPGQERIQQNNSFEVSFAGSEANVAVDLAIWGKQTSYITSLPENELGQKVLYDINRFQVDTSNIRLNKNFRLGLLFLEKGANQLGSKVLYDRSNSAFANDIYSVEFFENAFEDCNWFHWSGITPGLGYNSIENVRNALKVASKKKMQISCDLNYRGKLWNFGQKPNEIMPELLQNARVILGNEEDAIIMLGLSNLNIDVEKGEIDANTYQTICNAIFEKFPNCEIICFSIRESKSADHNNWSSILATRNEFIVSTKYSIKNIVDRVGAGDSFSAGIIYGLNSFKDDYKKTLEFATAASCLKHSIKGDYCICNSNEIEKLVQGNSSGRINR